jgi:hypothetical protein
METTVSGLPIACAGHGERITSMSDASHGREDRVSAPTMATSETAGRVAIADTAYDPTWHCARTDLFHGKVVGSHMCDVFVSNRSARSVTEPAVIDPRKETFDV